MRTLTDLEQDKIKVLTKNQVSLTLIEPTENGLKKSIMDATAPVRNYLKENNIHDYALQEQGPENKVQLRAKIYEGAKVVDSTASLYRPQTKNGDPRIWFSGLTKAAGPNDKELERVIKLKGINLSVDKVLDAVKTITTIRVNVSENRKVYTKTLFLTEKHQTVKPLFEPDKSEK